MFKRRLSSSPDVSQVEAAASVQDGTISGLVRSIRKQKYVAFIHISDGSSWRPVQAVSPRELVADIHNGSYVELKGKWVMSEGQGQDQEFEVSDVTHVGASDWEYPIQKKTQTLDFLRTLPHLRVRTPFHSMLVRARSSLVTALHQYFARPHTTGPAIFVQPPLITSSDCEGAGETFVIQPRGQLGQSSSQLARHKQKHFFKSPKYMTVSSQLHLESYAAELPHVWTLSPTFRAEESDTPRHLSEFYMVEAELRSVGGLDVLMDEVEFMLRGVTDTFYSVSGDELYSYYSDPRFTQPDAADGFDGDSRRSNIVGDRWVRCTYTQAIRELKAAFARRPTQFRFLPTWSDGLQLEHEKWLVEHVGMGRPVFVTHYPRLVKPFYMLASTATADFEPSPDLYPDETDTVACFDLLFPHGTGELVGGSLREHRLPELIASMRSCGLLQSSEKTSDTESEYPHLEPGESLGALQWYADLRRFGASPHGGYGMGFDRLLAYLAGVNSIRDTVGFPRYFGRADC